ncbi:hypothetical protein MMC20_001209 [Loxospora ochrophaea]|nr:hypothetical protein [Loxospora ochrophaea]
MILEQIQSQIEKEENRGLLRRIDEYPATQDIRGSSNRTSFGNFTDFYSNDYLGLTTDADLQTKYLDALNKLDAPLLGASGVRTTSGNTAFHNVLERRIAKFHGGESALLFNSGFDANYGVFSSVPRAEDIVLFDDLVHTSVREGIKASRASRKIAFKHNDSADAARILKELVNIEGVAKGSTNVFLSVETLYSMDGDMAPLALLAAKLKEHLPKGNGYLILDEAHATGMFGTKSQGVANLLGLEQSCFIQMHTYSKAPGTCGAAVICPKLVRTYLINFAKSFRYSTSQPAINLLAISTVYDFFESGAAVPRAARAFQVARTLHRLLRERGYTLTNMGNPTYIIGLLLKEPRALAAKLELRGFIVTPVTFPVVPRNADRLRICIHANNTIVQAKELVQCIEDIQGKAHL